MKEAAGMQNIKIHLKVMLVIFSLRQKKCYFSDIILAYIITFSEQYLHHHDTAKTFDIQIDSPYKEFTEDLTMVIEYNLTVTNFGSE